MQRQDSWVRAWAVLAFALAACSAEESAPDRSGSGGRGSATDNPIATTTDCTQLNQTQPCSCGNLPGRQVCNGAGWGTCECAPAGATGSSPNLAGNNRSDIHFDWQRTAASGDLGGCLPGKYEGTFGGIYWSYIATLAPISGLAVPIANVDTPGAPSGFNFTVEPAEGGETVLKIKGMMNGLADLVFPFTADLDGQLDCKTKTYTAALLNGKYSVLIEGIAEQKFTGEMTGTYDVRTHTLVEGSWQVWETSGTPPGTRAPALPRDFMRDGFGGFGTWAAALPTDKSDPKLQPCPMDYECASSQLGPNKLLCNWLLGPPGCTTDAECATHFAGSNTTCLQTSMFSTCLQECRP